MLTIIDILVFVGLCLFMSIYSAVLDFVFTSRRISSSDATREFIALVQSIWVILTLALSLVDIGMPETWGMGLVVFVVGATFNILVLICWQLYVQMYKLLEKHMRI